MHYILYNFFCFLSMCFCAVEEIFSNIKAAEDRRFCIFYIIFPNSLLKP